MTEAIIIVINLVGSIMCFAAIDMDHWSRGQRQLLVVVGIVLLRMT